MQTAPHPEQASPSQLERSTIRKVSLRLVPFVALMFFINFLDRTVSRPAHPCAAHGRSRHSATGWRSC